MSTWQSELTAICVAVLVGSAIGIERQFRDKAAGLRTLIFICMGATLFTLISRRLAPQDPVRIAANVVTGVGFLGAGVILRHSGRVVGVTTAAVIGLTAALGMAIGSGFYLLAVFTTCVTVVVLTLFRRFTRALDRLHEERSYIVTFKEEAAPVQETEAFFEAQHLACEYRELTKAPDGVVCCWRLAGSRRAHKAAIARLLADPRVRELRY